MAEPETWRICNAFAGLIYIDKACRVVSQTLQQARLFDHLSNIASVGRRLGTFSSNLEHLSLLLLAQSSVQGLNVNIPFHAPAGASVIAQDYLSLSIEQDRWTDWVGKTSRNEFFYNSLENLVNLTGVPPRIRVGGQSGDVAGANPNEKFATAYYDKALISKDMPYPGAFFMELGPLFYPTVRFLPRNTRLVTAVNYAANDDWSASWSISDINDAFSSPEVLERNIILEAIELGHQPDRYGKDNSNRNWDPWWSDTSAKYITEWTNWVTNIINFFEVVVVVRPYTPVFWTGSISPFGKQKSSTWSARHLVNNGLLPQNIAPNVKTFSQHHYSGTVCRGDEEDLRDLVSKPNIRRGLDALRDDIAAVKSKGLEYVLGEANSFTCHGAAGVSNVASSAVWALDYLLYSAQIGISRVYFHQGVGYKFNFLQPTSLTRSPLDNSPLSPPSQPHIEPSYYAAIIAAEAIGSSSQTHVVEIPISDDHISGYAFYVGTELTKAVFINSNLHLKSEKARSRTRINIQLEGASTGQAKIKRLFVPSSDATEGLTWGGLSFETADALPRGTAAEEVLELTQGLDLQATEIALVTFQGAR